MNAWNKWKRRPQNIWLRRALFQVHLWTGIGLGLYVVLMSVTGSAVVFRRELTRSLAREPRVATGAGARMSEDALQQAAKRAYPDYEVTRVSLRKNPDEAAEVWLERRDKKLQRLFNTPARIWAIPFDWGFVLSYGSSICTIIFCSPRPGA
jgi:uncharacterized iron-regulated membrane protein